MQSHEVMLLFCDKFSELGLNYMTTGSVASILYGEPRLTHDIDLVVALKQSDVDPIVRAFPIEEFYCPPEEVIRIEMTRIRRGHFNLIHHLTGFKADVFLANDSTLCCWAFENIRAITIEDSSLRVAPPEYVIINKLLFHKEGGSEKHLRDIRGILESQTEVDWAVIEREAARNGVRDYIDDMRGADR